MELMMNYFTPPMFRPGPFGIFGGMFAGIFILAVVDFILKLLSSYRAARNGDKVWFVFLLLLNTAGILPAIYLVFFSKKDQAKKTKKRS